MAEAKPAYKRSHSAMNTKVVIPAFRLASGKVVGAGEGGQLPVDPLELVKSIGIVGEVMLLLGTRSLACMQRAQSTHCG